MAFIIQQLVDDQRVQLGNEEFKRQFNFGNNWASLRICLRLSVNRWQGSSVAGGLVIGVTSGTDFGYTSPLCTDFCGQTDIGNFSASATYYGLPSAVMARKVGSVTSTVAPGTSNAASVQSLTGGLGCMLLLISRAFAGATTMNIQGWTPGNSPAAFTRQQALNIAEGATTGLSSQNTAVNITCGTFYDSFSLSWANSAPTLEIGDITVVRVA